MGDGRWTILLFLSLLVASSATKLRHSIKKGNKFYETNTIPQMKWNWNADNAPPYKHEIVVAGGLVSNIREGSNFSVHPDKFCSERISFVVQLDPPGCSDCAEANMRQQLTCTVMITIDDGHVEVWYGLCLTKIDSRLRKFNFPLPPMAVVYFNFDRFTMRVNRKDSDFGQDFEMGRIDFISKHKDYTKFSQFRSFLYADSCPDVSMKEVYVDGKWRNLTKSTTDSSTSEKQVNLLLRMVAIFTFFSSFLCLILATMYIWSINVPFFTNGFYKIVLALYKLQESKGGMVVTGGDSQEQNSCKTAEDQSEDDDFRAGKKEDLFGEKGKNRAPMRAPQTYILPDYDAPYEDDPEPGISTAIPGAPTIIEPGPEVDAKGDSTPVKIPESASAAAQPEGQPVGQPEGQSDKKKVQE
ncbi:hypothetical protein PMAYCL1PPCAC_22674, partial [Pristionchus mayeri]